jgi:hypothetical protein
MLNLNVVLFMAGLGGLHCLPINGTEEETFNALVDV